MIVAMSFDDGRIDNYTTAFPILKERHLSASIHVTTGFVDGTFKTDEFGESRRPLSVESIKEMSNYGIDISSHGDSHIMAAEDFFKSKSKILSWVSKDNNIGFSVPNSSASKEDIEKFLKETNNAPLYVRVGRDKHCKTIIGKINYILYRLFHFQSAFNSFNKNNINYDVDKYYIKSCVIKKHIKAKHLISFIKKYSNTDAVLVLMLHSVVDIPSNDWEWNKNDFMTLCSSLAKMREDGTIQVSNLVEIVEQYA